MEGILFSGITMLQTSSIKCLFSSCRPSHEQDAPLPLPALPIAINKAILLTAQYFNQKIVSLFNKNILSFSQALLLLFLLPCIRWTHFAPTTSLSKEPHGFGTHELVSFSRGGETMRYNFWDNSELKLLLNGMLVDHDLTSSLQAWIEADSVPDK